MLVAELQGYSSWEKKFKSFGKKGREALMKAFTETAIESASVMAENCPVVTRRLASSVHFETPTTRHFVYKDSIGRGFNGSFSNAPTGLTVMFGTNVDYAEKVNEISSSPRFFEKGKEHAKKMLNIRLKKNFDKLMK